MSTPVLRVLDRPARDDEFAHVGAILRGGGIVAFPTETVYGLAVSAEHPQAIARLLKIKGRPRAKPLTVMVADFDPVLARCHDLPPKARALAQRFWPGPLTLVLATKASRSTAEAEGAAGGMTGFRLPSHPLARGLVRAAGVPLLVPSANPNDKPPATTAQEVLSYFPTQLDLIIDGGPSGGGTSSTVVQVVGDVVTVLREGAIPSWRIEEPGQVRVLFVCTGNTDRSPLAVAVLKRRLAERLSCTEAELEERGFRIESAGVAAEPGRRASRNAREIARQAFQPPLDLDGHRSRRIDTALVEGATRIVCMERDQRESILAFFPHRERDVMLLDPEGEDVADPVGRSLATYERLVRRLDTAAELMAAALAQD